MDKECSHCDISSTGEHHVDCPSKKFKFGVFDNGKPVSSSGFSHLKGKNWGTNLFDTLDAANEHAKRWLGSYWGKPLNVGSALDYSGYGDVIEIRKIEVVE